MASIKPRPFRVPSMDEVRQSEAASRMSSARLEGLAQEVAAAVAGRACAHGSAGAGYAPPSLTGGEHQGNAGTVELVLDGGQVKIWTKRTGPDGGQAFIDWINFTFHEDSAFNVGWPGNLLTDGDVIDAISYAMTEIFGFGVTGQYDKGRNFYRAAYALGEEGYGFVAHGGQRNTVMVSLSGTGCAAARVGWEYRLRAWLETVAVNPKLTRIDVAADFFHGEYSPQQASIDYDAGLYRLSRSPVNPQWEGRGNWKLPHDPRGLTAYIGVRTSGKFARVYHKGRQLGAPDSDWTRLECEYKSVDRILTFDMLTAPGAYLAGAYPAWEWVNDVQDRPTTIRNSKIVEKQKKEDWIHKVCGADLHVLCELEEGETPQERAFNLIERIKNESKLPKWAATPDYRFSPAPIHEKQIQAFDRVPESEVMAGLENLEV